MELWDLYNEKREKLNRTHSRECEMRPGEYHVVVEIWTINSKEEILTTLRHPDKKEYPNYWENTGGSILAGESSREGAIRELEEETGIHAQEEELIFLGTHRSENNFYDIYMVKKDVEINNLKMQEGETIAAKWVTLDELNRMTKSKDFVPIIIERLKPFRQKFEKFIKSKGRRYI